jgi:cytochrome c biogenesis protein CcmG/thiol:disulfide interchange protein DsbE
MRLPGLVIIVVLAALFALLGWRLTQAQYQGGSVAVFDKLGERRVEQRVPADFELPFVGGEGRLSSTSLKGQIVMVDFYASWCAPCRQEAPLLSQVWREYQGRGAAFVGVGLWDDPDELRKFDESLGVAYPTVRDDQGLIAVDYGVSGIPEKFFLDRDGRIVRKFVGPMTAVDLRAILDSLLG